MKPRKHVNNLKPYTGEHGVEKLAQKTGKKVEEIAKLEYNENPLGPAKNALQAVQKLAETNSSKYGKINTYPYDITYKNIKTLLAKNTGAKSSENIVLGNGSDEIIELVLRTFVEPGEEVLIPVPAFGGFETYAKANKLKVKKILCEKNLCFDPAKISKNIGAKTRLVFICHPHNPTGFLFPKKDLKKLSEKHPNTMFLVDEAYIDFCPKETTMDMVGKHGNIFVSRTLAKSHGLAGLRIGYGVSNKENINNVEKLRLPFNVNIAALVAADAVLNNPLETKKLVEKIVSERGKLSQKLGKLDVVEKVYESHANFLLVRFKKNADSIQEKLFEKSLLVRNYSKQPALKNCLRITVGTSRENEKIISELSKL